MEESGLTSRRPDVLHPVGRGFEHRDQVPGSTIRDDRKWKIDVAAAVAPTHPEHRGDWQEPRERSVDEAAMDGLCLLSWVTARVHRPESALAFFLRHDVPPLDPCQRRCRRRNRHISHRCSADVSLHSCRRASYAILSPHQVRSCITSIRHHLEVSAGPVRSGAMVSRAVT
jgi:hypothetical protein